jgi:hypothetical protein
VNVTPFGVIRGMSDRLNDLTSASSRWSRFFPEEGPPPRANPGASDAEAHAPLSADRVRTATIVAIIAIVAIEIPWLAFLVWLMI